MILRELTRDRQVGGRTAKKGTGVVVLTPFFHPDNENLPFADKLSPDQCKDNKDQVIIDKGFVPFSSGPAKCPANNLVPMVASLVLDGVLKAVAKVELIEPQLDREKLPGTLNNFEVKLRLQKSTSGQYQ